MLSESLLDKQRESHSQSSLTSHYTFPLRPQTLAPHLITATPVDWRLCTTPWPTTPTPCYARLCCTITRSSVPRIVRGGRRRIRCVAVCGWPLVVFRQLRSAPFTQAVFCCHSVSCFICFLFDFLVFPAPQVNLCSFFALFFIPAFLWGFQLSSLSFCLPVLYLSLP